MYFLGLWDYWQIPLFYFSCYYQRFRASVQCAATASLCPLYVHWKTALLLNTELLPDFRKLFENWVDGRVPILFSFSEHRYILVPSCHHLGLWGQHRSRWTRPTRCCRVTSCDFPSSLRVLPHWVLLRGNQASFKHGEARVRNRVHRGNQTTAPGHIV